MFDTRAIGRTKLIEGDVGLAEELGLSPWTVRRWRLNEGLPVIKIGGRFFYRLDAVESWLVTLEKAEDADADKEENGVIRAIKI